MRKPAHLINSTIVVEDGEGNEIGEVKQRWHLWKRNYDIYLGRRQFADIQGNFLAWEFVLRDEQGGGRCCYVPSTDYHSHLCKSCPKKLFETIREPLLVSLTSARSFVCKTFYFIEILNSRLA